MMLSIIQKSEKFYLQPSRQTNFIRYVISLLLVAAATGFTELVTPEFSPTNLIMIYLLVVVLAAVYLGRGPAILASITGVLAFDYFFVPPQLTLSVADTEYLLSLIGFLIVGLVISYLAAEAREQALSARMREAETFTLYTLSQDLATSTDFEGIYSAVSAHINQIVKSDVTIILLSKEGYRVIPQNSQVLALPQEEKVVKWVIENNQTAGKGTPYFTNVLGTYLPLPTAQQVIGVLGVQSKEINGALSTGKSRLLEAFASQIALAIEHSQLAEQSRQIKLLQATENLHNALLNSISHDLRTPLVSITGALSTLEDENTFLEEGDRKSLVETAREEADRLNRLVGNLLDMTRLESGAMRIKREPTDIQDLVGTVLGEIEKRLENREVKIDISENLPLVPMDFVLIVHALVNLIDNALKYSPESSPLEIKSWTENDELLLTIRDHGVGIPPEDIKRIFDKFYRVHRPEQVTGTGLGLAISKGIVEAHGGRIWAENHLEGGTVFTMALPMITI